MTPDALADLHAACFPDSPWSASYIASLLEMPSTHLLSTDNGFLLASLVPPEAEILTLCVHPDARRSGQASRLVRSLQDQVKAIFLEVADDNPAAQRLYETLGFHQSGRRAGYYLRDKAPPADALVLNWTA